MKNIRVYCAGGWFGPNQNESLTTAENVLRSFSNISPYFPRHDGVKLSPNELHDPILRKKVFEDNVANINHSTCVVAVCDGRDGFYDTGTLWEIGYATSQGIPVIAYDPACKVSTDLKGISNGFIAVCSTVEDLKEICSYEFTKEEVSPVKSCKILFIGPDTTDKQREQNEDLVSSVIVECHGSNFRWVDSPSSSNLYDVRDAIFDGVDYMVSVIDDRHPVVSWMMGQAYSRSIPVITYTNFDYGVNIMLLCSLLYHCKGKEELKDIMQRIKRDGMDSLPSFDDSAIRAL